MNKFFYLLILILLTSCYKNTSLKSYKCQIDKSIEIYPDSSLFSKINCMQYYQGKLFLLDKKRGDVVWVDETFTRMTNVAQHGMAPDELVMPLKFSVLNDTVYILDFGSRLIKMFSGSKMVAKFTPVNANDNRFAINECNVYLSATTDSSCYLKILKNNEKIQKPQGKVQVEETVKRTIMLNRKHIFYNGGFIYAVSGNLPFIEKYDAVSGQLLQTFDLLDVEVIRSSVEYEQSLPYDPNSYYIYISDACLYANSLYLLCASRDAGKNYNVKTILKISLEDKMRVICSYILPHDIYSSFCVSDSFIYAFRDGRVCEIEKILLPDEDL